MRVAKYLMERAGFTSQLFGSPLSYPPLSEQSDLGEISPARRCHRDGVQDSRCRGVVPYPVAVQHVGHRVSAPPPNGEPLPTVAVKEHPPHQPCLRGCTTLATGPWFHLIPPAFARLLAAWVAPGPGWVHPGAARGSGAWCPPVARARAGRRSAQDQLARAPTVRWGSPCFPALGPGADVNGLPQGQHQTKCPMSRYETAQACQ